MGCSQSCVQLFQPEIVKVVHSFHAGYRVTALVETEDKKIACATSEIVVFSYDTTKNEWKKIIKKRHRIDVFVLSAVKGGRLLSAGANLIQVWTLSDKDLTLIKEIEEHTKAVYQIIPLSKERLASCSWDKTIKIWKDDGSYKCMNTLQSDGCVAAILQLKGKEELVSASEEEESKNKEINFWNLDNYTKTHTVAGHSPYCPPHMIEVPDGNVAITSYDKGESSYCIVIIDTSLYEIKKIICVPYYITHYSSLCVINDHSFVYAYRGTFVQISCEDYSVVCKTRTQDFGGFAGMVLLQGGLLAIEGGNWVVVVKPCQS